MQDASKPWLVLLETSILSSAEICIPVNGVDQVMIILDIGVPVRKISYNNNLGVFP
jgi:hypothetical protein